MVRLETLFPIDPSVDPWIHRSVRPMLRSCLAAVLVASLHGGSHNGPASSHAKARAPAAVWNSKGWPGGGSAPNAANACPVHEPSRLLAKFGVLANPNGTYYSDQVDAVINTMGSFGHWPALPGYRGSKQVVNGGIPQKGNLSLHLAAVEASVQRYIPSSDYSGDAVVDFEAWIPDYDANAAGRLSEYQTQSQAWVRARNPAMKNDSVALAARQEFNEAARTFMRATLQLCKAMRPKASWGYWGYPNCGSSCRWDPAWKRCPIDASMRNNRLDWLFDASDALYPGIYLCNSADDLGGFLPSVVNEVKRVAQTHAVLQIRPYVFAQWESTRQWLDRKTLDHYLGSVATLLHGHEVDERSKNHMVVWGGYLDPKNHTTNITKCELFERYLNTTLGPALSKLQV